MLRLIKLSSVILVALVLAQLSLAAQVKEDIFTEASFPSSHASTIVELKNGDLLAAWFGGSAEGKPDVAIYAARHTAQGWSAPFEMVREPHTPAWNPVLYSTHDGRLWLYYKFGPVVAEWTGARMFSTDDGKTWSVPEHLPAGLLGPIRAKPYVAPNGTVVAGSSTESYHAWAVWMERSTDDAKSFTRTGPYLPVQSDATKEAMAKHQTSGVIQPSVISMGGRHLRFYARPTEDIGRICIADSFDEGKTWRTPRLLDLPNPNSGIDVVRMRDGRIVLIYNDTLKGRSPLKLAVSRDGEHFRNFLTLEDTPGGEFSYPALVQAKNGDLLMTYTWNRKRIRFERLPLAQVPQP